MTIKSKIQNRKSKISRRFRRSVGASGSGDQVNQFSLSDFGFWIRRSKRKKVFCFSLPAVIFALCSFTEAQPKKVSRIGYVAGASRSTISTRIEAFRQGMRELGYVEDKNIVIEWRFGEGKQDRLPALVAELVRLR